jgi:phosphotransferase system HPr (HPr) family protein
MYFNIQWQDYRREHGFLWFKKWTQEKFARLHGISEKKLKEAQEHAQKYGYKNPTDRNTTLLEFIVATDPARMNEAQRLKAHLRFDWQWFWGLRDTPAMAHKDDACVHNLYPEEYVIIWKEGFHARPMSGFVTLTKKILELKLAEKVLIRRKESTEESLAHSIMHLMMLAAGFETRLIVTVEAAAANAAFIHGVYRQLFIAPNSENLKTTVINPLLGRIEEHHSGQTLGPENLSDGESPSAPAMLPGWQRKLVVFLSFKSLWILAGWGGLALALKFGFIAAIFGFLIGFFLPFLIALPLIYGRVKYEEGLRRKEHWTSDDFAAAHGFPKYSKRYEYLVRFADLTDPYGLALEKGLTKHSDNLAEGIRLHLKHNLRWFFTHRGVLAMASRTPSISIKSSADELAKPMAITIPLRYRDDYYTDQPLDVAVLEQDEGITLTTPFHTHRKITVTRKLNQEQQNALTSQLKVLSNIMNIFEYRTPIGIEEPLKITVVDRSPLLIEVLNPKLIAINRLYFDFLIWLMDEAVHPSTYSRSFDENTAKSFKGITYKSGPYWSRDDHGWTAMTDKPMPRNDMWAAFEALTVPILFTALFNTVTIGEYYRLMDQTALSILFREEVENNLRWFIKENHQYGKTGKLLRALWEVWGPFVIDEEAITRIYMPEMAARDHLKEETRSAAFNQGTKEAAAYIKTQYFNRYDVEQLLEEVRSRGHSLLEAHPKFATEYLGKRVGLVYARKPNLVGKTENGSNWEELFNTIEYYFGYIKTVAWTVHDAQENSYGRFKYSDGESCYRWRAHQQLALCLQPTPEAQRLADMFILMQITRWGEDESIPANESLYHNASINRPTYKEYKQFWQ